MPEDSASRSPAPHPGHPGLSRRKAVRDAPAGFASFKAGPTTRTPAEILAHIGDLMDWGLSIARGKQEWHNAAAVPGRRGGRGSSGPRGLRRPTSRDRPLAAAEPVPGPVRTPSPTWARSPCCGAWRGGRARRELHKADIEPARRASSSLAPPPAEFD